MAERVSSEGRITQPVEVRPRLKDSRPCSVEGTVERKRDGEALRQHSLKGGCATFQVVTCSERGCSLVTRNSGGRDGRLRAKAARATVVGSHIRWSSPAGYQLRHGTKGDAETGEALDPHRRKLDEEAWPITVTGKWLGRGQGGGSGCSTVDLYAAKRTGREGPEPTDTLLGKGRQG